MAQFLSEQPGFKVPRDYLTLLNRAIADRKRCARWFHQVPDRASSDIDSDISHWHFIEVLQDVEKILLPLRDDSEKAKSSAPAKINNSGDSEGDDELASINPFSVLEGATVEVVDDQRSNRNLLPEPSRIASCQCNPFEFSHSKIRYNIVKDVQEELYLLFGFLDDLHAMREFLKSVWEEYRDGKVDLMSASLITNTAVELVHKQQEDLINTNPNFKEYAKMLHWAENLIVLGNSPHAEMDVRYRFCVFTVSNTADMIGYYLNNRHKDDDQFFPPTKALRRSRPWKKIPFHERIYEEEALLASFLMDIDRRPLTEFTTDQLTRELFYTLQNTEVTFAAVFAASIFLTMHRVLDF
ncbi:hypothetical protein HDV00_003534 [Rhizophlyctis rosea]|nr:hypothetical protein HDV00_003534 [Rhizophlyctis rosea]